MKVLVTGATGFVGRHLVQLLLERGARIRLNLGRFPYPDHEPMAFWGSSARRFDP